VTPHQGRKSGTILAFDKPLKQLAVVWPAGLSLRCQFANVSDDGV
jgi:hypothetical protein